MKSLKPLFIAMGITALSACGSDPNPNINIECSQDPIYLNHVNCVAKGDVKGPCIWSANNTPVEDANDCNSFTDLEAKVGLNNYRLDTKKGAGETEVELSYEVPKIGDCNTTGVPGAYVSVGCPRKEPITPNENDTYFVVIDSNLPGEWMIQQSTGTHASNIPLPDPFDMSSLYLKTSLCVNYNSDLEISQEENNCEELLIEDF